jgi:nifR3 family TIM-barrel protein
MSSSIDQGFHIGSVLINPRIVLAPMEDITNQPFRILAKRVGRPGLMVSEFVSAMAVHYNAKKTVKKMLILDEERPLAIQIFGSDVSSMVEAAQLSEEMGADIVDINMGCWVPKVVRTGAGAALLKDPDLAERIASAVVKSVKVPVTVKVRAGWDGSDFSAPELGKRFEAAGTKAITIHARYAKQGFEGQANWQLIGDVKQAVSMPVIGNGDIRTPEDALRMLKETGCDGIMVGRAAISNPWVLARIHAAMIGDQQPSEPTLHERCLMAKEHLRMLVSFEAGVPSFEEALALPAGQFNLAEMRAVKHMRGQAPLYIKGVRGAAQARERLTRCNTVAEVEAILDDFEKMTDEASHAHEPPVLP